MATYVNSRRAIHQGRTAAMIPGPLNPVIPKPGGTPVPIPNLAHGPGLQNGTASVKIDGKPVSVAGSRFDSHPATPDRLGGISGVTSQVVGGAAEPTSYSGDTKFEGRGAVRSFDTTKSNSMVINPGRAISWILSWLPEPYEKLAHKVLDKLPAAFGEQLAALGDSLTDPASLIGPALKLLAKFIPGLNAVVGGAAMAQAASEMSALAGEVEALLTPPLTDAKLDQIADLIADQVAATSVGFVTGKATRALRKLKPPVKRIDNNVNPNTTGKIIDDAKPSMPAAAGCELGTCTPVIFATGVKIISAEDFALPGLVPLDWTRFYRSSDRRAGWLGYGWSTPLSVELVLVYGQLHYYDERGRLIRLPALARGAAHFDARHKFTARRDDAGRYSLTRTDGTRLDFGAPRSGQWRLPLLRLSDRNDNAITLHYPDFDGAAGVAGAAPRPLGLTDSAGRRLQFVWTNDELLAEVRLQDGDAGAADGSLVLVRYAYDRDGNEDGDRQANLVAAADALGGINHYRYQQHLMVAYTTKNGFTHHQQWSRLDAAARVVRTWTDEPGLLDTRFDYDIAAQVTHVTDALGRTSSYHYNGNHEVVAIDEPGPDGHPVRTETPVDEAGNPLASVDALGRVTRYAFDERGNLISVTDAAGAVSRFGYDQLNLPVEVVDALGHRWRNRYDERGNLLEHEDALGHRTRYHHDERGLPVAITDALGKTRQMAWDQAGLLVGHTDCSGQTTRYAYDRLGRISASVDALGQRSVYEHDALGQLRQLTQPDGAVHRYDYDGQGNLLRYVDPLGAATTYAYNGLDQPVQRQDAQGGQLSYRYDAVGRLGALGNENGAWYQFHYDAADNLIQEIGFDGRIQRYRYNAAGELTELHEREDEHEDFEARPTAALPRRTYFRRDALGRLVAKAHTNGQTASYAYDRLGRLVGAGNAHAQLAFAYDALSQLVQEVQQHDGDDEGRGAQRFVLQHRYDALGNRTDTVLPSGRQVQWLYYGSGHLHQVQVDGRVVSDIERDALHREVGRTQGALSSRYEVDPMGRLSAHRLQRAQGFDDALNRPALPMLGGAQPGPWQAHRQFKYDAAGNLSATGDALRGPRHYRYDRLGRIRAAAGADEALRERFDFDPAGNLLNDNRGGEHSAGGTSAQRDRVADNRLAVYQDLRFAYDVNGNVIERRIGWHTLQQFAFNAEHQIAEATVTRWRDKAALRVAGRDDIAAVPATVQRTSYHYDPLGRRIDKQDAFGTTRFAYDGDLLVHEQRGSKCSEYLYEPDGFVPLAKLESQVDPTPADVRSPSGQPPQPFQIYYYQCDQIGAPQELTDEQGRIVWAASYKVWGQTQALQFRRTGTDDVAVLTTAQRPLTLAVQGQLVTLDLVEQPLRYQGQYFDVETGLHYNRFRYYDPVCGRFLQQDPIGLFGGLDCYAYATSPLALIDPYGLAARSGPGIRGKLYPSRERKGTRRALEEKQKGSDGNILCAKCGCQLGAGNTSVQHEPPLVETHNSIGRNTNQETRNDLYNSTATSLVCLPCQKVEGGTMSHTQQYRTDMGPNFEPRKPRKGKGCNNNG